MDQRRTRPSEVLKMKAKFSIGEFTATHGHTRGRRHTKTYGAWMNMRTRCLNPKSTQARWYERRGLTICERWLAFENFLADMGQAPEGMTLERKDNNAGYSSENCVWDTPTNQANNRRSNRWITFNGTTLTLAQWARKTNLKHSTIGRRLKVGWSVERALTEEVR